MCNSGVTAVNNSYLSSKLKTASSFHLSYFIGPIGCFLQVASWHELSLSNQVSFSWDSGSCKSPHNLPRLSQLLMSMTLLCSHVAAAHSPSAAAQHSACPRHKISTSTVNLARVSHGWILPCRRELVIAVSHSGYTTLGLNKPVSGAAWLRDVHFLALKHLVKRCVLAQPSWPHASWVDELVVDSLRSHNRSRAHDKVLFESCQWQIVTREGRVCSWESDADLRLSRNRLEIFY